MQPRSRIRAFLTGALIFPVLLAARPAAAQGGHLLRGPHPFLKENQLSFLGGINTASGGAQGGLRAQASYGYDLWGSLWLDLQIGLVDGTDTATGGVPCNSCGRSVDVMGGLSYRLQMNVPVIPYAKLDAGLLYFFPDRAARTAGIGARGAVGAKYFLYDWLGFGLELGGLLGVAGRSGNPPRPSNIASLDLMLGVEWQF